MLVLALDTSTSEVIAGIARVKRPHELVDELAAGPGPDGAPDPVEPLASRSVTDAFGHAEHLMPLVTAVLADAGRELSDLDAVVVGVGPGPFTGLRVGIVTAAALGDALGVPVHGVPSHDAAARRALAISADGPVLVVTDARRREVYFSAYAPDATRLAGPGVADPGALADLLAGQGISPTLVTGAGADLVDGRIPGARRIDGRTEQLPLPGFLVECALRPLVTGAVPGPLIPLYLRRPDATPAASPKAVLPEAGPRARGPGTDTR